MQSPPAVKRASVQTPVELNNAPHASPIRRLVLAFCSWKLLLLIFAIASPGPGYDTSTSILLDRYLRSSTSWQASVVEHVVSKLTRWDAIYFANSSARGHLFEQEWAFSWPVAQVTALLAQVLPSSLCTSAIISHAVAGILISHISHFLAVLALYHLTYNVVPCANERKQRIAFTTACLHIISPAGLFLSASYGEAPFALFNFLGMSSYVASGRPSRRPFQDAFYMSLAGLAFGVASMIRGNGLLSGLILAWDAVVYLPRLPAIWNQRAWRELVRLGGTLLGGLLVAAGYAGPQLEAYLEYCTNGNTRPWCARLIPSIYTWVQSHYWGVGFLRYWTLSNLPLFALATPKLMLLLCTAWLALTRTELITDIYKMNLKDESRKGTAAGQTSMFTHAMARFALPQLVLAVLATTSFHVQIINRISSGYPVWYIVLAIAMHSHGESTGKGALMGWLGNNGHWLVRAAIMYAIIQGGLYASFMPPA